MPLNKETKTKTKMPYYLMIKNISESISIRNHYQLLFVFYANLNIFSFYYLFTSAIKNICPEHIHYQYIIYRFC